MEAEATSVAIDSKPQALFAPKPMHTPSSRCCRASRRGYQFRSTRYTSPPPNCEASQNGQGANVQHNHGRFWYRDRCSACADCVTVSLPAHAIPLRQENPVGCLRAIRTQNVEGKRYGLSRAEGCQGAGTTRRHADCIAYRTITVAVTVVRLTRH
jgi:hypothetical protein